MPRYHFHIHDGENILDEEGTELPNLTAARAAAVELAGRMLADKGDAFWNAAEWQLEVQDDNGLTLFTLAFIGTTAPAARGSKRG